MTKDQFTETIINQTVQNAEIPPELRHLVYEYSKVPSHSINHVNVRPKTKKPRTASLRSSGVLLVLTLAPAK